MAPRPPVCIVCFPNSFPSDVMIMTHLSSFPNSNVLQTMSRKWKGFANSMDPFQMVSAMSEMRSTVFAVMKFLKDLQTTQLASPPRASLFFSQRNFINRSEFTFGGFRRRATQSNRLGGKEAAGRWRANNHSTISRRRLSPIPKPRGAG